MALRKVSYPCTSYTAGRPYGIQNIIIHHMAGVLTAQRCAQVLNSRKVSAHYSVGSDGVVGVHVAEGNRAWHAGDGVGKNSKGNDRGIGIETANSSTGGNWPVSEQSFNILVELCYDIAKRNNLLPLVRGKNLFGHRDCQSTACPGDYLYSRLNELCDRVNAMDKKPTPEPVPVPAQANISYQGITRKTVVLKKDTNLWDFNFTKWADAKAVKAYKEGDKVDVVAIATNVTMNAKYYMTAWSYNDGNIRATNGFNVVDCEDYVAPVVEKKKEEPKTEEKKEEVTIDTPVTPEEPKVVEEKEKVIKEEIKQGAEIPGENVPEFTEEDYNEVMKKAQQTVELADEAIKKFGIKFTMSNKVYDVLKTIAIAVLPFISFVYLGLANIWGFGFGEQVDATIQLIITAINVVLGATVLKSSSDYKKK